MPKYYKIKKSSNPKKETAWKWFSKYIRLRDSLATTGDIYFFKCITCGEVKPFNEMDAGHGIPGRMNSILFNEDLTNGQCRTCNREGKGEFQMYKHVLIERHGQDKWDFWQSIKKKAVKYTDQDLEAISDLYRQKTNELLRSF